MISPEQKTLIQRIVNVFETGTPGGKYDTLVIYRDGKDNTRQITYGRSQTTEQGNLRKLVEMYIANAGKYADKFAPYVDRIGRVSLVNNTGFKDLLVEAARRDPIMRSTQDSFFDIIYWSRAGKWFGENGFGMPLSMLVIYDSFIHSGGILMSLRRRFMEVPPVQGGKEQRWISSYVEARHQWLKHHQKPILRKTIYRTQTFIDQIDRNNWTLAQIPVRANGIDVR